MTQRRSSGHDGGLVDGHGILGVIRHDSVARLVVRRDLLVLFVYFHTPPLWACGREEMDRDNHLISCSKPFGP